MNRGLKKKEYVGVRLGYFCPECRSNKLTLFGKQMSRRRMRQRYLCTKCLRTTVYPQVKK